MPEESSQPAVEVKDLTFFYPGQPSTVLEDVSFTVSAGSMVSVVGPNGGGKTTLLRLFLGLLEPNRGKVRVFGETPRRMRRHIGYMPQYPQYDPQFPMTVTEVVLMGRVGNHFLGRYSRKDRELAREALAEVGLENEVSRQFSELSGGQRQRVLIARALVCEPELLLLDEPTANIDPALANRFYTILQKLNERMTILISSHDLGFVSEFVSSVICVNRTVVVHPSREITGEIIEDIYGHGLRMVRHDRHHSQEENQV